MPHDSCDDCKKTDQGHGNGKNTEHRQQCEDKCTYDSHFDLPGWFDSVFFWSSYVSTMLRNAFVAFA